MVTEQPRRQAAAKDLADFEHGSAILRELDTLWTTFPCIPINKKETNISLGKFASK